MSEYNGWRNYATWRVNLEVFDGMVCSDWGFEPTAETRDEDVDNLSAALEDHAYSLLEEQAEGWALDLAKSFLHEVEWEEIAEHMVDDFIAENS